MNDKKNTFAGGDYARQALLPEGFRDQLAPVAEFEASILRRLVDVFLSHGYDRVAPPLVEYEESLLAGPGSTKSQSMFRLMDPDTQRTMAVRADMTVQMSRLAVTRLLDAPRPLRLAYGGNVIRMKGSQVRPARQFNQAGVELIGDTSLEAELEVIAIAVEALEGVGVEGLTLDLTTAPMVPMLADQLKLADDVRETVIEALDAKDGATIEAQADSVRSVFSKLLDAAGPASHALSILKEMALKGAAGQLVARLDRLVEMIESCLPGVSIIIDPCESHGFEYKSGIGFALFGKNARSELGRGGRYSVERADGVREDATGFSVYLDSLVDALPDVDLAEKVFLPAGTDLADAKKLRAEGLRTIQGLTEAADPIIEAQRLGCSHIFKDGKVQPV